MPVCSKTLKPLPERNVHFIGMECREPGRNTCPHHSNFFIDGTNCVLLRRSIDVKSILELDKKALEKANV